MLLTLSNILMNSLKFAQNVTVLGKITLQNIRVYAHHGCLKEETAIGSQYRVDITVNADLKKASLKDSLSYTVDYVHLNRLVKDEMKTPSKLLEHVAKRILNRVFNEMPLVLSAKVSVSKINPPIGGDVEMVTVCLKEKRGA